LGASQALFENRLSLVQRGFELLTTCPCALGCPACILDNRWDMIVADELMDTLMIYDDRWIMIEGMNCDRWIDRYMDR
jgi:hypothetical protein